MVPKNTRLAGLWTLIISILLVGMNTMIKFGYQNFITQVLYYLGFIGLIIVITNIHIAQANRSGMLGTASFLLSVISLLFYNIIHFINLAEILNIENAHTTYINIWGPALLYASLGAFVGLAMLGVSITVAGVFSKRAGVFLVLGSLMNLTAQVTEENMAILQIFFDIGGYLFLGLSLSNIGWALWKNNTRIENAFKISNLDRIWGGPLILIMAFILIVNAIINTYGELNILSSAIHVISHITTFLGIVILHTTQNSRSGKLGWLGFLFAYSGTILYFPTGFFIYAQVAGLIDNNSMLMASWVDIPIGRIGLYMLLLGYFLFGLSVIRAQVFPTLSGWLILAGLSLMLPSQFQTQAYFLSVFWVIGAIMMGLGFAWMGRTMISQRNILPT